ncbi:MAG: hypothetical protein ACOCX1_05980, partial [Fimbriimonadaceae bacterium]
MKLPNQPTKLVGFESHADLVKLQWAGLPTVAFEALWLRQNAREDRDPDAENYTPLYDLPLKPKVRSAKLEGDLLKVRWHEEELISEYPLRELFLIALEVAQEPKRTKVAPAALPDEPIGLDELLEDRDSRRNWLNALLNRHHAPLKVGQLKQLVRLSLVVPTESGEVTTVKQEAPRIGERTRATLGAFRPDRPQFAAVGGAGGDRRLTLTDFAVVLEEFRLEHPDALTLLVSRKVRFERNGLRHERAHLELNEKHGLDSGAFCDAALAPLPFGGQQLERFTLAYQKFARAIAATPSSFEFELKSEQAVVFDTGRYLLSCSDPQLPLSYLSGPS